MPGGIRVLPLSLRTDSSDSTVINSDAEPQTARRAILDPIVGRHMILDDDDRFGVVGEGCFNRPGNYLVDNESIWTT